MHAHKDAKKRKKIVKRKASNPLDFDEVEELIDEISNETHFVKCVSGRVWLKQTRSLLEYIDEECCIDLWTIACRFDHLEPPALRDEFELPPPTI